MGVQYEMGENELRNIFQNIPAGVCVGYIDEKADFECVLLMINDAVCQMTGFSRREISERFDNKFSNLICKSDRTKYQETVRDLYEFPHRESLRYAIQKKSGEEIIIIDKMQSVRQHDGKMWIYSCLLEETGHKVLKSENNRVEIQTFEHFNVLVDGNPIIFRSEKAKELLALLVDRKGSYVSNREIITNLWEDELVDNVTQARCRKVVFNLKNTLKIYGIEDIVESKMKGYRRLATEKVTCDLYQYLSGDEEYEQLFQGTYMEEYSWAEMTLSRLLFEE